MTRIELSAGPIEYTDNSYTLIPLDQPARFAELIREFAGTAAPA